MNDRFRLTSLDRRGEEIVVGHIADKELDGVPRELAPNSQPFRQRPDRRESLHPQFMVPLSPREVVGNGNLVAFARQVQRRSPATVSVPSQYDDTHVR